MSISLELSKEIKIASKREWEDDHLSDIERMKLVSKIRKAENISSEVPMIDIYMEYVVDSN